MDKSELITYASAARILGISYSEAYNAMRRLKPKSKVGRTKCFDRNEAAEALSKYFEAKQLDHEEKALFCQEIAEAAYGLGYHQESDNPVSQYYDEEAKRVSSAFRIRKEAEGYMKKTGKPVQFRRYGDLPEIPK